MPFPPSPSVWAFQQTQRPCQDGPLDQQLLSAELCRLQGGKWEPQALCVFLTFSIFAFGGFPPFCYMRFLEDCGGVAQM